MPLTVSLLPNGFKLVCITDSRDLSRAKTFANFVVLRPFTKVLTVKIFIEYKGIIIIGRIIILDNGVSIGIMAVASFPLAIKAAFIK